MGCRLEPGAADGPRIPLRVGVVDGLPHREQVLKAVAVDVGQQGPVEELDRARLHNVVAHPAVAGLLQPEQRAARPDLRVELAHEEPRGDQQVEVAVLVEVLGTASFRK